MKNKYIKIGFLINLIVITLQGFTLTLENNFTEPIQVILTNQEKPEGKRKIASVLLKAKQLDTPYVTNVDVEDCFTSIVVWTQRVSQEKNYEEQLLDKNVSVCQPAHITFVQDAKTGVLNARMCQGNACNIL